jgi:hypothetical protein
MDERACASRLIAVLEGDEVMLGRWGIWRDKGELSDGGGRPEVVDWVE